MEHQQFISNDLNFSPGSNKVFQPDRFIKKINQLNIPDTIIENCSGELSGDSLKMEAPKVLTEIFNNDDKENISINQQVIASESLNGSINIAIDNSYIRQCERKLLEGNNSDDAINNEFDDKSVVNSQLLKVSQKFNDTISTPPSLLRKEISLLRSEMAETHEFHDLEIQLLKEQKFLNETDPENYLELFEKYSALMELYTTLKNEYEEYRKAQEKIGHELQSKTANCLESLCSQIEASDNSLNFSSASFVSFNGGIRSSTMMEDISEVEATVVHDATVLANDPLSITTDGVFKTPLQTPLRKELFPQEMSLIVSKPSVEEVKEIIGKLDSSTQFESEQNIQFLNLETAFYDKVKEVKDLEKRLFKMEDMSLVLQSEFERISSVYAKENDTLKESLSLKTEQLNELTQKLFTETISLNPSLRDSLIDAPGKKLLLIFIETIMENCKKIKGEVEVTTIESLRNQLASQESKLAELEVLRNTCENLERKLSHAESTVLIRDEEIRMLQSHASNVRQTREDLASAKEALSELESQLTLEEAEKKAAEKRCLELEIMNKNLNCDMETNEKLLTELQVRLSSVEEEKSNIKNENFHLKQLYDELQSQMTETEKVLKSNESEMVKIKESLSSAKETINQLKSELKLIEEEKTHLQNQCSELQTANQTLLMQITAGKISESDLENVKRENDNLKRMISESESIMTELKAELQLAKESRENASTKIEEMIKEIEQLTEDKSGLSKLLENVEESQKNLADALTDSDNDIDPLNERLTRLIENTPKVQDSGEARDIKIISVFVETMSKTCKGVQNELIKNFDSKKLEWETQRNVDLNLIENLQDQIKLLTEKSQQDEDKISEMSLQREDLMKLHEDLKNQMMEAERIISTCNEEIKTLKSQEVSIKQAKDELAVAEETILQLKSQLSSIETDKSAAEQRCRELEGDNLNLRTEIDARDMITKQVDELKTIREKLEIENVDLKQQIQNLEEMTTSLKNSLEIAEEEQDARELRIKDSENEIDLLKQERDVLVNLRDKFENLEKNNKNLMDVILDLQMHLNMPEDTLSRILSGDLENKKMFSDAMNNLIKSQVDSLKTEKEVCALETKEIELTLKKTCSSLETKLSEVEKGISAREEEVRVLQLDLSSAKAQKAEAENRSRELEDMIENLKREIDLNEKTQTELQTRLSSAEEKKSELENENIRLKESYDSGKARMVELEEVVDKTQAEIKVLKSNSDKNLTELEELKKSCENLESKLSEANSKISSREEEIEALRSDLMEARGNFVSAKTSLTEFESQLMAIETQKMDAENRYRELEKTIESLRLDKENIRMGFETEKSKIETENNLLKQSLDALKAQMSETENAVITRDQEIRELKTFENQLTSVKESLATADETILKLKTQLESIEVEKSEMENRCCELQESNQNLRIEIDTAKDLEKNPVYEKIQTENGDLRERVLESEKMMAELKAELNVAKENQMNNICKVEELIREIEELKRENNGFSSALNTIEETQKNLADVLSWPANDSDLPSERITKLIEKTSGLSGEGDRREARILSDFVDTITRTCQGVQNELINKFDSKKLEWETQKDVDLQNLQDQIAELSQKNSEHEVALKRTKQELMEADEAILKLKSQLTSTEVEKVEMEVRCRKLEEKSVSLQAEIDTKETVIKGLDELKTVRQKMENENEILKRRVLESEEVIVRLKTTLEIVKEEQIVRETRIKDSQIEIDTLKKEKEVLVELTEKLENVEKNNELLMDIVSDVQTHLDIPEDTLRKILTGNLENKKMFSEKINHLIKTETEGLKAENKHLKLGNDNLKEKVKQLTRLIGESASEEGRDEIPKLNASSSFGVRNKATSRRSDLCARRLDKLEEINHNLTELITRVLTMTEFPDPDKLKLYSVRDFPNVMKKVVDHLNGFLAKLKEENAQLDEECETYANIIKDLKKEAAAVWKGNKEATEAMEGEISRLKEEKNRLESEKQDLAGKISKLDAESQKLKSSKSEGAPHNCVCGNDSKKINELKRTILIKEQKLLELQDLEAQTSSYKSQIEYLKNALEREKKKTGEEKEKNKKLQNELNEATKNQKTEERKTEENQVLDELRMRGSLSGGIVQEFVDKEKMRKLAKDIGILKELCRARYAEIKRLEAVNAALRNGTPKNSNQMDSPIRTRGYNTRSKIQTRDLWKTEINGKENSAV